MDLIDRQAAIDLVGDVCDAILSQCGSHYDGEDEVYEDIREVDAILKCNKEIRIALRNLPSAQPEIIRCKDCRHWLSYEFPGNNNVSTLNLSSYPCKIGLTGADWFCGYGERRTDE